MTRSLKALAHPHWAHVQHLQITFWDHDGEGAHLRSNAMSCLCRVQWPILMTMDLSENWLRYGSISWLVSAHWPSLSSLNLSSTRLSTRAAPRLLDGDWPRLATLYLSKVVDNTTHTLDSSFFGKRCFRNVPQSQPARWPFMETFQVR